MKLIKNYEKMISLMVGLIVTETFFHKIFKTIMKFNFLLKGERHFLLAYSVSL
jgi:hypothetical protein